MLTVNLISSLRDQIRGANKDLGVIKTSALEAKVTLAGINSKLEANTNEITLSSI